MNWSQVSNALREASVDYQGQQSNSKQPHVFPGAVLLVGVGGDVVYHEAFGCRSLKPDFSPMHKDMVFDVASLTKPIVTTTLAMQFVDSGQLELDYRLGRILQTFATLGKEEMTLRHLLAHCAGFPATQPYFRQIAALDRGERSGILSTRAAAEYVFKEIYRTRLDNLPGRVNTYSDIGFMLLQHVVETVCGGQTLDKLAQSRIFAPLKLGSMGFIDISKIKRRGLEPITEMIAPTVDCQWRGKLICGEVHDDNAWAMGGIAGHAGVFSTAIDVHRFASAMLSCWHGESDFVSQEVVQEFCTKDTKVPESTWALGWDTPSAENSSAGSKFSRKGFGHLAFTGCSLWIDPERNIDVVLLSNRIHPSIENQAIKQFRPLIHDLVLEVLEGS